MTQLFIAFQNTKISHHCVYPIIYSTVHNKTVEDHGVFTCTPIKVAVGSKFKGQTRNKDIRVWWKSTNRCSLCIKILLSSGWLFKLHQFSLHSLHHHVLPADQTCVLTASCTRLGQHDLNPGMRNTLYYELSHCCTGKIERLLIYPESWPFYPHARCFEQQWTVRQSGSVRAVIALWKCQWLIDNIACFCSKQVPCTVPAPVRGVGLVKVPEVSWGP